MSEQIWEYFMLVYREPDEMAHYFWRYMDPSYPLHISVSDAPYQDAILKYYQSIDHSIGEILQSCGADTNIVIMSDHGTGPFYKDVFLNEWLRQKGWLALNNDNGLASNSRKAFAVMGITRSNISSSLRRLKLGRLEQWLKSVLGDRIEILPASTLTEFPNAIDWQHTSAYSFGYHGQIYINLIGREPEGIVSPGDEYDRLCDDIRDALMSLGDPEDGKPVVDQVVHRRQVFHGPAYDEAPDLIVIMRKLAYITRSGYEFGNQPGNLFAPPHHYQSGSHRMEGTLILAGPDILQAGYKGEAATLMDLAPTILYLLGCPVPDDMDGNVLSDWLSTERQVQITQGNSVTAYQASNNEALTPDEQAEIVRRLKELGYLE